MLVEDAQRILRRMLPPSAAETLKERIAKSVRLSLSYGFTGAHDIPSSFLPRSKNSALCLQVEDISHAFRLRAAYRK